MTLSDLVSHKNLNDRNTQQPGGIGILSYTFEHCKVAPNSNTALTEMTIVSVQLLHIPVTVFSQTDLFLV